MPTPKNISPKKPRKSKSDLIYPIQPVEMVEVDRTEHYADQHRNPMKDKSAAWYKSWGNKCPVCKAPANVILEPNNGKS